MDTETTQQPKNEKKNHWNLIWAVLFFGIGFYRLYIHFFTEATLSNFRLILAIAFIGFGVNSLYKHFKQ